MNMGNTERMDDPTRVREQWALQDQAKDLRARARRLTRCRSVSDAYRESLLCEAEHRTQDEQMIGAQRLANVTKIPDQPSMRKITNGNWRW
jgi:hypothetical protein